MKKLLTTLALLLCLISNTQYQGQYFLSDNGVNTGGSIIWLYSWDQYNTVIQRNILEFDTTYFRILSLKPVVPSVNTNTRLAGINANGGLEAYDISALPTSTMVIQGVKGTSTVSGLLGITGYTVTHNAIVTPMSIIKIIDNGTYFILG